MNTSFVYLATDGSFFKIGFSDNPEKRISQLKTANPKVRLLAKIKSHNARELESDLHAQFSKFKYNLEWFYMDSSISKRFNIVHIESDRQIGKNTQFESYLPTEVWNIIEEKSLTVYKMHHATRLNGVCDVYHHSRKVVDIKENNWFICNTYFDMAQRVIEITSLHKEREPIKKLKSGRMSYKEFKNNMRQ